MVRVDNSNAASFVLTNNDASKSDHVASGRDPVTNAKVTQMESKGFFASLCGFLKSVFNSLMSKLGFDDKPLSERKVSHLPAQADKGAPTISSLTRKSDELATMADAFSKKSKKIADKAKGSERPNEGMNAVSDTAKEAVKNQSMPKSMLGKTNMLSEEASNFQEAATILKEKMQQENEAYNNSTLGKIDNFFSNLFFGKK